MEKNSNASPSTSDVAIAISNERVKLTANWINSLSVAMLAVGALAPAFALLYGTRHVSLALALGTVVCIVACFALHYWAWRSLKDIRQ